MKTITFRYFDVSYTGLTTNSSIVERLINKLKSSAESRMMPINNNESEKSDLISDFAIVNNRSALAGTSIRIVNSRDTPIITETLLKKDHFQVSSIPIDAKDGDKTCLDYFFFCLSEKKLIVTLDSRSGIGRFETYLNFLLNTAESGEILTFTPSVDEEGISVSDIKKITLNNNSPILKLGESRSSSGGFSSKLLNLSDDVLKKLFGESDSLKEIMTSNICSAELVIKFSRPRNMTQEEYKRKTIGAILKPLDDPDSIKFQTNGKKIKGSTVLKIEQVQIKDDNGIVLETDVYKKMMTRME